MPQIYELYAGTGDHDAVDAAAKAVPPGSQARRTARFYADLYMGLLGHAQGDAERAKRYLTAASALAQRGGTMGDVARVARNRLTGLKKESPTR